MAATFLRPDGRRFVSVRDRSANEYPAALSAAIAEHSEPLHVHVDLSDVDLVRACDELGFKPEMIATRYDVPFAAALSTRRPPRRVERFEFVPADQIDADALFALDISLRQDVPGIDGWVGNREWFDDEMASAEFDPTGYLVARMRSDASLVGLVRFWKKESAGPSLGLLAVAPEHRCGFLAHTLLQRGLAGAGAWGHAVFSTHTAQPGLQRRIERLGGVTTGTFAQMIRS